MERRCGRILTCPPRAVSIAGVGSILRAVSVLIAGAPGRFFEQCRIFEDVAAVDRHLTASHIRATAVPECANTGSHHLVTARIRRELWYQGRCLFLAPRLAMCCTVSGTLSNGADL